MTDEETGVSKEALEVSYIARALVHAVRQTCLDYKDEPRAIVWIAFAALGVRACCKEHHEQWLEALFSPESLEALKTSSRSIFDETHNQVIN